VRLLGGPLSPSRGFVSAFVGTKAIEVARTMARLAILDDPQVELLLLRACMGLCRMVHVLRCSPRSADLQGVAVFDTELESTLRRIVVGEGAGFGHLQAEIAALPMSGGGLQAPGGLPIGDCPGGGYCTCGVSCVGSADPQCSK
jgi:hypothetical protein